MSKTYDVAVVGVGMVGKEMVRVLRERKFPIGEFRLLATKPRMEVIDDQEYKVSATNQSSFEGADIAFFAGTEGEGGAAKMFGWNAALDGTFCIDNGSDFRMDKRVPLIVPEVNAEDMGLHQNFVANPNCSTIQMVVALAPLHRVAKIKRIVVSTYQAVSGTGRAAVEELEQSVAAIVKGEPFAQAVYPHQIAHNVIPQIGSVSPDFPGYYTEEVKMVLETQKIFNAPDIKVSATCVRVPVYNGHSESVNVEFEKPITADEARAILEKAPGVIVTDGPERSKYPLPIHASGTDAVYVGRIREDKSVEHGLAMWVVADNIRKGAALNAVQIAETAIKMELI